MSTRPRRDRSIPLRYDDGFRGTIAVAVSMPFIGVPLVARLLGAEFVTPGILIAGIGVSSSLFSAVYILWTHVLFSGTPRDTLLRIASAQHRRGPSRLARMMGFGGTGDWAGSAAIIALLVAIGTAVVWYTERSLWLPLIALATAVLSWALMAYAFALKYLRLDAAGERIEFDIEEPPVFTDFVSMAVMISAAAALSASTPRTRAGLDVVRTHTFTAFAFNSLVIAMTVSLVVGLLGVG